MIDSIQAMMDAVSESLRDNRGNYHLTLQGAIDQLDKLPKAMLIRFDYDAQSPGRAMSYRGYYSDLSFAPTTEPVTVELFLKECRDAMGKTFQGYKGGDFTMDGNTPLWVAEYGDCGRAIMGLTQIGEVCVLQTKDVD